MNIYDFLRSRDIAAYCQEINKTWNAFEMAVIIGRSDRTISEKHAAWRELIEAYPDMPSQRNIHGISFESLHKKLREVMLLEVGILETFRRSEPGTVYMYKIKSNNDCIYSDTVFSCYENAISAAINSWGEDGKTLKITIEKLFVDDEVNKNGRIEAMFDDVGKLYWLSINGSVECRKLWLPDIDDCGADELIFCDRFYVDIPTPFKRGDILTIRDNTTRAGKPTVFVLDYLDRDNQEYLNDALSGKRCDGSDLTGWGFYVDEHGVLYDDYAHDHDSFEYHRGELDGSAYLLYCLSSYLWEKISLSELLSNQCKIMLRSLGKPFTTS